MALYDVVHVKPGDFKLDLLVRLATRNSVARNRRMILKLRRSGRDTVFVEVLAG